jgi:hypothetical protein
MKAGMATPRPRVVPRAAEEMSDHQIEQLISVVKREADLIEEMEQAVRAGDRNLVWQIAQALCRIEDQVRESSR